MVSIDLFYVLADDKLQDIWFHLQNVNPAQVKVDVDIEDANGSKYTDLTFPNLFIHGFHRNPEFWRGYF